MDMHFARARPCIPDDHPCRALHRSSLPHSLPHGPMSQPGWHSAGRREAERRCSGPRPEAAKCVLAVALRERCCACSTALPRESDGEARRAGSERVRRAPRCPPQP